MYKARISAMNPRLFISPDLTENATKSRRPPPGSSVKQRAQSFDQFPGGQAVPAESTNQIHPSCEWAVSQIDIVASERI